MLKLLLNFYIFIAGKKTLPPEEVMPIFEKWHKELKRNSKYDFSYETVTTKSGKLFYKDKRVGMDFSSFYRGYLYGLNHPSEPETNN